MNFWIILGIPKLFTNSWLVLKKKDVTAVVIKLDASEKILGNLFLSELGNYVSIPLKRGKKTDLPITRFAMCQKSQE